MKQKEAVIRHSYDQGVTRLARLALFADRGEVAGLSFSVTLRQEQLAIDDTLHLAIALRRLIDALSLRDKSLGREVLAVGQSRVWWGGTRPPDLSLHDALNKIIHSEFIEVYCFSFQLEREGDVESAYQKVVNKENFRIDPLIAIKSDRGPLSFCDLQDFCKACDEIVDAAEEEASDGGIYLGEF